MNRKSHIINLQINEHNPKPSKSQEPTVIGMFAVLISPRDQSCFASSLEDKFNVPRYHQRANRRGCSDLWHPNVITANAGIGFYRRPRSFRQYLGISLVALCRQIWCAVSRFMSGAEYHFDLFRAGSPCGAGLPAAIRI